MGKKTSNKKKLDQQKKEKKKKKLSKKIGLAKYIQTQPSKPKRPPPEQDSENAKSKTSSKKRVAGIKTEQKNLSLVERCKLQMSSSLLRLVDEDLYSNDANSVALDKDKFIAYHKAYAAVCDNWPSKPIDYIIKFIKKRLLTKKRPLHKYKFADIGCGPEPLLKMKLPPKAKVLSFDLVSTHEDVIEANMEKLPIDDDSVHCIVYSLSLMAKTLGNVIIEGKRILKVGGSILIVEVTSRFEGNERRFIGKLERLGLKFKSMTSLKPNDYFTFFHFTKSDSNLNYSSSCLNIQLKPCVYKAR